MPEEPFCSSTEKAYDLLLLGQTALSQKKLEEGLFFFKEACELKPGDPKLYFEQGLSLFDLGSEEGCEKNLLLANKKFKMATSLLPEYFEAWQLWGLSLSHLGQSYQETHYFFEAEEKLIKALDLTSHLTESDSLYDLHFEYGKVKMALAKRSGEACDWQISLEAFEKASKSPNHKNLDFWNQFGLACLGLTLLINDTKICVKAIHCFKHAITQDSSNYDGWRNLAKAMQFLYYRTHDEDHFSQANECFGACSQLRPLDPALWLFWALFLLKSGKATRDIKKLRSCLEKTQKAHALDPQIAESIACWGEALCFVGNLTEEIELIYAGQNKISEALEMHSESPEIWHSLGESFNCLGAYFEDIDYYYQAIEKFQTGLSIDRSKNEIWFSIGKAYTLIGDSLSDIETLEKSFHFYRKAISLSPSTSSYHFEYACSLTKAGELTGEEHTLECAILEFEKSLYSQKNALYLHPEWLFEYAKALDLYAEFFEEKSHYHKAIEILSHVLMIDPDFPGIHYHLALVHSHLGELIEEIDSFYRALHFFKLALKHDEENDEILLNLGVTLINISELTENSSEREVCYQDAEIKLIQAAKSGNLQAYYQLACLFSLKEDTDRSIHFLLKAESFDALPYTEELLEDEWLSSTRGSSAFKELVHYLEKKETLQEDS